MLALRFVSTIFADDVIGMFESFGDFVWTVPEEGFELRFV